MSAHLPECPMTTEDAICCSLVCICDALRACEQRVRDRIVAGINDWCKSDPVISRADSNDAWDYAEGVRFTCARIERGDFK